MIKEYIWRLNFFMAGHVKKFSKKASSKNNTQTVRSQDACIIFVLWKVFKIGQCGCTNNYMYITRQK